MDFLHPERLWLLGFWPILVARVWLGRRRRRRDWAALRAAGKLPGDGAWAWTIALMLLIVAIAQPRWGRIGPDRPPGQDVVLLVDTSRSMGVEDASPDRLGLAVSAARGIVEALGRDPGGRAAVVAFASRGVVRCPLTEALGAAEDALDDLRPGDVAPPGTDLGAGLDAAIDAFDPEEHAEGRTIVVFSDGEDHAGAWEDAARKLEEARVVVHSVVVGDPGRPGDVPASRGAPPWIYRGKPAASTRSDAALAEISRRTGGVLVPLGLAKGDAIGAFFRDRLGPATRKARDGREPPERAERFSIFIAGALAVGLLGGWKSGRRRPLILLGLAAILGASPTSESPAGAVAEGNAAYQAGDYLKALAAFDRASRLDPKAAIPRYDAGSALFRLGRPAEAADRYREARDRADESLRTKIDFALGNAALARGQVEEAIRHYDDCLASRSPGRASEAVRRDAAENRRFAILHRPRNPAEPERKSGREPPSGAPKDQPKGAPDRKKAGESAEPGPTSDAPGEPPAGSRGQTQPADPNSPRARLDAALKDVRDARSRRLPDPPPPSSGGEDRKDW